MGARVVIEVKPTDVEAVLSAARRAVDQGRVGTEGEEFDTLAAIGAVREALRRAQAT